jgi:pimeloyl-ACP methyl ester carboxylesterase
MPIALLTDSTEISYEILGAHGPWIVAISSGRHSMEHMAGVARPLAAAGYRVLLHDRRNCGRSSLSFNPRVSEEDMWIGDLAELLTLLGIGGAIVVGMSSGARVAIRFARRHPNRVRALLLWGLSGGEIAIRFLDEYYYGQYVRSCRTGGMEAVCGIDHFAGLCAALPGHRDALLAMDPLHFESVMDAWRDAFLVGSDNTVLGIADDELRSVAVPTASCRTTTGYIRIRRSSMHTGCCPKATSTTSIRTDATTAQWTPTTGRGSQRSSRSS